jgi:AbiV family abortive infection protein
MSPRKRGREDGLSTNQLGELARKTLENAVALLDEAQGLERLGHFPRAFSLGILAAEELGKFLMCFGAVPHPPDDKDYWREFSDRLIRHEPKYSNALAWTFSGLPSDKAKESWAQFSKHVDSDLARKMLGLYVDVDREGNIISPGEAIDPDLAFESLTALDYVIRGTAHFWGETDFGELFELGLREGARELADALEAEDEDRIRAFLEKSLGGET